MTFGSISKVVIVSGMGNAESHLPLPPAVFHILVAVADRERHGYAIMQDVIARTDGKLRLSPGTLYGSIKRMLQDGLIEELEERPDPEHDDTRRRYYRITRVRARGRDGGIGAAGEIARAGARHRAGAEEVVSAMEWRERCYRALLHCYPAEFRYEYASEMTQAFPRPDARAPARPCCGLNSLRTSR